MHFPRKIYQVDTIWMVLELPASTLIVNTGARCCMVYGPLMSKISRCASSGTHFDLLLVMTFFFGHQSFEAWLLGLPLSRFAFATSASKVLFSSVEQIVYV